MTSQPPARVMQYPQLVIYETSQRLVTWLREDVQIAEMLRHNEQGQPAAWLGVTVEGNEPAKPGKGTRGWLLREPRQSQACLRLLRRGGPIVLVLQLSGDGEAELALLDHAAWLYPEVLIVVVAGEAHRPLVPLAWDLGATAVIVPPQAREQLQPTVLGLMQAAALPCSVASADSPDGEG
jgi:hypothetical protein